MSSLQSLFDDDEFDMSKSNKRKSLPVAIIREEVEEIITETPSCKRKSNRSIKEDVTAAAAVVVEEDAPEIMFERVVPRHNVVVEQIQVDPLVLAKRKELEAKARHTQMLLKRSQAKMDEEPVIEEVEIKVKSLEETVVHYAETVPQKEIIREKIQLVLQYKSKENAMLKHEFTMFKDQTFASINPLLAKKLKCHSIKLFLDGIKLENQKPKTEDLDTDTVIDGVIDWNLVPGDLIDDGPKTNGRKSISLTLQYKKDNAVVKTNFAMFMDQPFSEITHKFKDSLKCKDIVLTLDNEKMIKQTPQSEDLEPGTTLDALITW